MATESTEEKQILPWLPYFVMAISRQQKRATEVFFSVVLRFLRGSLWANSNPIVIGWDTTKNQIP